jgi:hypothetical protein
MTETENLSIEQMGMLERYGRELDALIDGERVE